MFIVWKKGSSVNGYSSLNGEAERVEDEDAEMWVYIAEDDMEVFVLKVALIYKSMYLLLTFQ